MFRLLIVLLLFSTNLYAQNVTRVTSQSQHPYKHKPNDLSVTGSAATDGQCLIYDSTTAQFEWGTCGSGGGSGDSTASGWTDVSAQVQLVTSTDNVIIGGSTVGGKLFIDGDTNERQLQVQGHSTQTANLLRVEKSTGQPILTVDDTGVTSFIDLIAPEQMGLSELSDVNSATQGAGRLLVSDGTSFQSNSLLLVGSVSNVVSTDGKLGVGVTSPSYKLEVNGGIQSVGASNSVSSAGSKAYTDMTNTGEGTWFSMGHDNSVSPHLFKIVTGASISGNNGIVLTQTTGNVGINDGTPVQKLEVGGNINLSTGGQYMIGGAALSLTGLSDVNSNTQGAGRILISDGGHFNSASVSGDVSITSAGVTTISGSDAINVKSYGATGDGVTDDTAAINLAITAAASKPLFFPSGVYMVSSQLVFTGPVFGNGMEGTNVSTIRASGAMTSVVQLDNTVATLTDIHILANDQATYGIFLQDSNYGLIDRVKVENALKDGIYFDPTGNQNGMKIRHSLIASNGTVYTTGTVATTASSTTVTFTGAADLTTLGLRPDIDYIKITGETIPNQVVTVTDATHLEVYPAPVNTLSGVAFSLKSGNGILITTGVDNNTVIIEGNSFSGSASAGLMDLAAGYGAVSTGNIFEADYFGRVIGSTSGSDNVLSATDIGNYYEINQYADIYLNRAIDAVIINPITNTIVQRLTTFDYSSIAGGKILTANIGIGTTSPVRELQIGQGDEQSISFERGAIAPTSGVIRFGNNTGYKMYIGRSRESSGGALNTAASGALITIQDNGNVGIGDVTPVQQLEVGGNINLSTGGNYMRGGAVLTLTGLSDVNSNTQGVGRILISDGSKFNSATVGGECTVTASGSFNCDNGSGATQLTELSDVNSSTQGFGRILISDGSQFNSAAISGCSLDANGLLTCPGSATELVGLSDVNSATATSGRILMADGGQFNSVAISGDVTTTYPGTTTIADNSVDGSDIAIGSDAQGDVLYYNGTDWARLGAGNSGEFLKTQGAAANPIWATGAGGATSLTGLTDVNSATQGAGRILVSDGFDFQSTTMSGDITITSGGVTAVGANTVVLTTDTTGSYAAGDAEAGNATGVACTDCVTLTTETAGNYAAGDAEAGAATSVAASTVGASQLTSSGVTATTYNAMTATVDVDGRITAAASSSLTGLSDVNTATQGVGRLLVSNGTKFNSVTVYQVVGQTIKTPTASTTYAGPKSRPTKTKLFANCECLQVGGTNAVATLRQCDGSQANCVNITSPTTCTTSSTTMNFTGNGSWTGGNDLNTSLGVFSGTPTDIRWSCELEL